MTRCRYLRRDEQMCTAEATMPDGDVLLCTKHLARAIAVLESVGYTVLIPESSRRQTVRV